MKNKYKSLLIAGLAVVLSFNITTNVKAAGSSSASGGHHSSVGPVPGSSTGGFDKKDEPKKDEPKKDEPKKDEPKKDEPKKDESKQDGSNTDTKNTEVNVTTESVAAAVKSAKKGSVKVAITKENEIKVTFDKQAVEQLSDKAVKNVKILVNKATATFDKKFVKKLTGARVVLKSGKNSVTFSVKNSKGKVINQNFKITFKTTLKKGQKVYVGKKAVKYTFKNGMVTVTVKGKGKVTIK